MQDNVALEALGWNSHFASAFTPYAEQGLIAARVAVQHRNAWLLYTAQGEHKAVLPGRLRRDSRAVDLPAVGDWVAAEPASSGPFVIRAVLPRRSEFTRKAAGRATVEQVIAANVDVVFLVSALDGDVNPRRIERYLALAERSGAQPVLVLSKSDLVPSPDHDDVGALPDTLPVVRVSSLTGEGVEGLRQWLAPGCTVALLGSSGVGKSTLINALLGEDRMRTGEVRADGRGRHTTTRRELVPTPSGALLLDTPGLRELQLWAGEDEIDDAFADIAELAGQCRFRDCGHSNEPDCAVVAAVRDGTLDAARLESWRGLLAEARQLEARTDVHAASARKRSHRAADRAYKAHLKRKND